MNVNTGHLINSEMFKTLQEAAQEGNINFADYTPVPEELELAAMKKLAGQQEAMVSLTSGGKLSNWARANRKARRKMARESRKRNRK